MVQRIHFSNGARMFLFLLAVSFVDCIAARAENPGAPTDDLASAFKDKIVMLEVNRSNAALETKTGSVILVKLRITKLGSRDFVIGEGYAPDDSDDYWYKDMLVGVPCESIIRFHAMTSKQFADYMKKWKEQSDK